MTCTRPGVALTTTLAIGCGTGPTSPTGKPVVARVKPAATAPVHAVHGSPIALLAVTTQGDAAITADETGAFRLWPSFDGTKEPIVIAAQAPRALAIAHAGDGFAIAILDRAGLVEIVRVAGDGTPRSRAMLDGAAIAVTATSRGFVTIDEDRAIAITDLAGTPRARLTPEPGARVETIVANGDRVLALASSASDGLRGRWIDVEHATWGATTPRLADLGPDNVVLGPKATVLVGKTPPRPDGTGTLRTLTMTVALATGAATRLEACDTGPLLGFVDDDTLACFDGDLVAWWHGTERVKSTAVANGTAGTIGIGGGLVVASYQTQLALATPMHDQYLGYDAAELPVARFTPAGIVVGLDVAHVIDRDFAAMRDVALPPTANTWLDVVPLDARYTLTLATTAGHGKQIAVYDAQAKHLGPEIAYAGREDRLDDEPSTGLLLGADDHGKTVHAIDPMTRAIGPARSLNAPIAFLVDPALADDAVVIAATPVAIGRGLDVVEYTLAGLAARDGKRTYRVNGEFRAIDHAGRLYMAVEGESPGDVVVYDHGRLGPTLPAIAAQMVRPSPDGAIVAAVSTTTLTVFDRDGAVRWAAPVLGVRDVAWQGDALIGQFETGFVRYDVATGVEVARKCGWGFGRWETPRTSTAQEGVVCD